MNPPAASEISSDFQALRVQHQRCAEHIAGDRHRQSVAEVSAWSVGQHLFHVLKANFYAYQNVGRILDGYHPLVESAGQLSPIAVRLLRNGRFPRGAAAPDVVHPPVSVTRDMLADRLLKAGGALSVVMSRKDEIEAGTGYVKHPLIGPLDAPSWIRFARIHTAHHLAIIDEIGNALPEVPD